MTENFEKSNTNTINTEMELNDDYSDDSDCGLTIVVKPSPRRNSEKQLNDADKQIIAAFENDLEQTLEEKAAKSNLNAKNVKHILKQVFTNEHVVAYVREQCGENKIGESLIPYEPKLTRSKAKELFSNSPPLGIPTSWQNPKKVSEVEVLLKQDFQEDSSGDEYLPGEDESEDERDTSILSESGSHMSTPERPANELPATPASLYTEDGVFKVPSSIEQTNDKEEETGVANIALRTRSKLSLSSTPLEVIEEAFMPPDITTDMYDMDCCDEVWSEFLTSFAKPFDESVKVTEDEDHDPEYNILADEEIDKVDREELRADKAVKITRKELNELMAELFKYTDILYTNTKESSGIPEDNNSTTSLSQYLEVSKDISTILADESIEFSNLSSQLNGTDGTLSTIQANQSTCMKDTLNEYSSCFTKKQRLLLEQQMRQHVQMLTQSFLLTYGHLNFFDLSSTFKEYLLNLKLLSDGKTSSYFRAINLEGALDLITSWEKMFIEDNEKTLEVKKHFAETLEEASKKRLQKKHYFLPFPKFLMDTILLSEVFIYPHLLPKIPFKCESLLEQYTGFTKTEEQLIAMGLEQFIMFFGADKKNLNKNKEVNMRKATKMIQEFMMTSKKQHFIYGHMIRRKVEKDSCNSIKYYFEHKKAPPTVHHVTFLKEFKILPPCKRPNRMLPLQWRRRMEELKKDGVDCDANEDKTNYTKQPTTLICWNAKDKKEKSKPRVILPNRPIFTSTPIVHKPRPIYKRRTTRFEQIRNNFLKRFVAPIPLWKLLSIGKSEEVTVCETEEELSNSQMLPSMPNLGLNGSIARTTENEISVSENELDKTPTQKLTDGNIICVENGVDANFRHKANESLGTELSFLNGGFENDLNAPNGECENDLNTSGNIEKNSKDNIEEINALMVASATVKNAKKDVSASEKKKAKIRKEYFSNLAMLMPPDPADEKEKRESFANAYFQKLKDTLDMEDYIKVIEIFNSQDPSLGDAVDLYKQVEPIFYPKYRDLGDEFLLFLNHEQANKIGKMIPFYIMNNMSRFLRKLEIYFKDQPSQVRKIYRSLVDLNECVDVTMDKVKCTILPLLKGNPLLNDWFLQIFLEERPPPMLLNGTYEEIEVNKELTKPEEEAAFETMVVTNDEDPYGGPTCICSCHKENEEQQVQIKQHCTKCGLRFIQGKVYVQTGKSLHPADVSFPLNPDGDHNRRLSVRNAKRNFKRQDSSPGKRLTSPSKDHHEESRGNNESEEDDKRKRARGPKSSKKTNSNRSPKSKDLIKSVKKTMCSKKKNSGQVVTSGSKISSPKKNRPKVVKCQSSSEKKIAKPKIVEPATAEGVTHKPGSQLGQVKRTGEIQNLESLLNPIVVIEKNFEMLPIVSVASTSKADVNSDVWTRDEDKIILETFQQNDDKEAFKHFSRKLKNRTVTQIKNRFKKLMILIQEMANSS